MVYFWQGCISTFFYSREDLISINLCRFYVDILHFFFFKKEFLEQQNF